MQFFLAAFAILIVLILMLVFHWGGQQAGPAGWLAGLIIAALAFGLTFDAFWVSQLKGLFLSFYVLAIILPALYLYNIVNQADGIRAIANALEQTIADRGILLIVLAWAFSGLLEGLAGFGLPIAIVAPMLVGLGVEPVIAVAAVAVGHSWSVTFGDMGVIFQTLIAVVKMDGAVLAPASALMLGIACLVCGFAAARILGYLNRAVVVIVLGILMGVTQYGLAISGITPLAAFGAGLVGIIGGMILSKRPHRSLARKPIWSTPLIAALATYGTLAIFMSLIALIEPLRNTLNQIVWQMQFPEVKTATGFVTPAGGGQAFRLTHPGASILLIALVTTWVYTRKQLVPRNAWRIALQATWKSVAPTSIGIISMVGLAGLMDYCGMTILLAQGMASAMGALFPIVSPLVGILGAFATGSNNNSNVLFGSLQKNAALLLNIAPTILIAAQTTGGSLGSMIAPAKIIVGCNTVGIRGRDGDVLRVTLPYGILIGIAMGIVALIFANINLPGF
jgi:lactate permease